MLLEHKYGPLALIAGASEGIGAAYASHLAAAGIDLVLVARRQEGLNAFAKSLTEKYKIEVQCISCDLAIADVSQHILKELKGKEVNILVYNAALSYIGPFENNTIEQHNQLAQANMVTLMNLVQIFGTEMIKSGKGAVIIMASLAGFQGSGYLAAYAASKAFNRVLAESLWYEWNTKGVDVIACCAGATATPNFINTKPEKANFFAPKVQSPDEVVKECFEQLGNCPSFIPGKGNKLASFIMQRLMPRKMAVKIMGDTTKKMYRI